MPFRVMLVLLAWLVSLPAARGQACPRPDPEAQAAAEKACRAANCEWARFGIRDHLCGLYSCAARTRDGGKPCRDRADCEYLCIHEAHAALGAEVTGKCAAVASPFGCAYHVDGGRIVGRVCAE